MRTVATICSWLLIDLLAPSARAWVLLSPLRQADGVTGYPDPYDETETWRPPSDDEPFGSFNLSSSVFRWSMPTSPLATEGLGGGIAWALHPAFCDALLPLFPEDNMRTIVRFITCDDLRNAINSAFSTWAMNHRMISFTDITEHCSVPITAAPGALTSSSAALRACPRVEVLIVPDYIEDLLTGSHADNAAYVIPDANTVDLKPRLTTGGQLSQGLGMRRATLAVSTATCWYFDATFCYHFHAWSAAWYSPSSIMLWSGMFVVIGSALVLFYHVARICCDTAHQKPRVIESWISLNLSDRMRVATRASDRVVPGGKRLSRRETCATAAARVPVCTLLVTTFGFAFAPTFYFSCVRPCALCYDFEATMAHEVGHVLGFSHTDTLGERNLRLRRDITATEGCVDPLLRNAELTGKEAASALETLMISVTSHRGDTCLTADDLEGLHALYPLCDAVDSAIGREPICIKHRKVLGYLRLLVSVGVPYLIVTLFIFSLQVMVRLHYRRQGRELRTVMLKQRAKHAWERGGLRASVHRHQSEIDHMRTDALVNGNGSEACAEESTQRTRWRKRGGVPTSPKPPKPPKPAKPRILTRAPTRPLCDAVRGLGTRAGNALCGRTGKGNTAPTVPEDVAVITQQSPHQSPQPPQPRPKARIEERQEERQEEQQERELERQRRRQQQQERPSRNDAGPRAKSGRPTAPAHQTSDVKSVRQPVHAYVNGSADGVCAKGENGWFAGMQAPTDAAVKEGSVAAQKTKGKHRGSCNGLAPVGAYVNI